MGSFGEKDPPCFSNDVKMTQEEAEVYMNSEGYKYVQSLSENAMLEMIGVMPGASKDEFMLRLASYLSIEFAKLYEELIVLRKYKELKESEVVV